MPRIWLVTKTISSDRCKSQTLNKLTLSTRLHNTVNSLQNSLTNCVENIPVRGYDQSSISKEGSAQSDAVRELFSKKQALLLELKNYKSEGGQSGIPVSKKQLCVLKTYFLLQIIR